VNRIDEVLFARVAMHARISRRRYAIMDRGAWGERVLHGVNDENNTQDFTGKVVDATTTSLPEESKKIGFFHPLFSGYIFKGGVVEVVPNINPGIDDDFIAIGSGCHTMPAYQACLDVPDPNAEPCVGFTCDSPILAALSGYAPPLGSDDSFAIYDKLTATHVMGPNEIPSLIELYGYDGGPPDRPNTSRPFLMSWAPNYSAFQLTFQPCFRGSLGGTSSQFGSGDTKPWWAGEVGPGIDCCTIWDMLPTIYGENWCAVVADKLRNGEWTEFSGTICQRQIDWILANC
jgi:hypothetical protein